MHRAGALVHETGVLLHGTGALTELKNGALVHCTGALNSPKLERYTIVCRTFDLDDGTIVTMSVEKGRNYRAHTCSGVPISKGITVLVNLRNFCMAAIYALFLQLLLTKNGPLCYYGHYGYYGYYGYSCHLCAYMIP